MGFLLDRVTVLWNERQGSTSWAGGFAPSVDWGPSHLGACVRQLDVLGGSSYINGGPHEDVQVVHFRVLLCGDKVSECVREVRHVLGHGRWRPETASQRPHL